MKKKWVIVTVVLVLAAVLGLVAFQSLTARQSMAEAPAGETAVVRRGTLQVAVSGNGGLAAQAEVSVAFPSGGRVTEALVEEGQMVEAGQALARLDDTNARHQVAQAEISLRLAELKLEELTGETDTVALDSAQAQVAQAKISLRQAELKLATLESPADAEDISVAQLNLLSAQESLETLQDGPTAEDIESAQIDLETAKQNLDQAKNRLWQTQVRRDSVAGSKRSSSSEIDSAEADVLVAEVSLDMAQGAYEKARLNYKQRTDGATDEQIATAKAQVAQAQVVLDNLLDGASDENLESAELSVEQARVSLASARVRFDDLIAGASDEDIESAQLGVEQARINLASAQEQLEDTVLKAPLAGTVTVVYIEVGEMAKALQPAVMLNDLAALEVNLNIDETDVAQVAIGQEARVSLDAFPGIEMAGVVTAIAPTANVASGIVLYPVTISLAPTTLGVRPGMTADVDITTSSQANALIVPLRAVHTEGDHAYVDRLAGDRSERVAVKLGIMTETEIEITSGLAEGDVVIVVPGPAQGSANRMSGPFGMFRGGH